MLNIIFKLFLTFNSTSLLIVVYWIKSGITIKFLSRPNLYIPNYISYLIYILAILLFTYLSILLSRYLSKASMNAGDITNIEYANDAFLPSYLGYFFVALDIPNFETFVFVYPLVFTFTFLSRTLYFNPVFLAFNFHFYNLTTVNNIRIFMITKKKIKSPSTTIFKSLRRINDFTFIDNEN